jgi:hypothetical protein
MGTVGTVGTPWRSLSDLGRGAGVRCAAVWAAAMTPEFVSVGNWNRYQHYKAVVRPAWIKLYAKLLDSPDWIMLKDCDKLVAIGLLLIASRTKNKIPNNPRYIKQVLHLRRTPDLAIFLKSGYLVPYNESDARQSIDTSYRDSRETLEKPYSTSSPDQIRSDQKRKDKSVNADLDLSGLTKDPTRMAIDGVIEIGDLHSKDAIKILSLSEVVRVCAGLEENHRPEQALGMWNGRIWQLAAVLGPEGTQDFLTEHLTGIWDARFNGKEKGIGGHSNPAAYLNAVTLEAINAKSKIRATGARSSRVLDDKGHPG